MNNKVFLAAILLILDKEIKWCTELPMEDKITPEFREGFIKGIKQAKFLVTKVHQYRSSLEKVCDAPHH